VTGCSKQAPPGRGTGHETSWSRFSYADVWCAANEQRACVRKWVSGQHDGQTPISITYIRAWLPLRMAYATVLYCTLAATWASTPVSCINHNKWRVQREGRVQSLNEALTVSYGCCLFHCLASYK
jgi:hypothetical protein